MNPSSLPAGTGDGETDVKLVAFYLPQFHPIEENDAWWGKGFTEWTNVTRATPLFHGHHQPHLPADLGFYDLRVRETRREQIRLAKTYGIDAFCYHYYWFSGKRLLEQPLDDMLADPGSDMPFCLCWANENWTRRWNGGDRDILIEQRYRPEDPAEFVRDVAPFLKDSRYLHIAGKPLLIVYRPQEIPNLRAVAAEWREHCLALGIGEIHLCAALTFDNFDYAGLGFDSGVEFPPHNRTLLGVPYVNESMAFHQPFDGSAMRYHDLADAYLRRSLQGQTVFRSVFPSWDNTARSKNRALFFPNGTPGNYEYWLAETIKKVCKEQAPQNRLVFINAWNEWAEGCHLEPDQKYGRAFLEATQKVKQRRSDLQEFPDREIPREAVAGLGALLTDLGCLLSKHRTHFIARLHNGMRPILARNPRLKKFLRTIFRRGRQT